MPKLTLDDLKKIKEKTRAAMTLREGGYRVKVNVHMGTCGIASGARKILSVVMKEIDERNLNDVVVTTSGCAGLCSREPMVTIEVVDQAPVKYCDLTEEKMSKIIADHVVAGEIVEEYALGIGSETAY